MNFTRRPYFTPSNLKDGKRGEIYILLLYVHRILTSTHYEQGEESLKATLAQKWCKETLSMHVWWFHYSQCDGIITIPEAVEVMQCLPLLLTLYSLSKANCYWYKDISLTSCLLRCIFIPTYILKESFCRHFYFLVVPIIIWIYVLQKIKIFCSNMMCLYISYHHAYTIIVSACPRLMVY